MKSQKFKKTYNVSPSAKILRNIERCEKKLISKEHSVVDVNKKIAKVYWIIFKLFLEGKELKTWTIAEEFFKTKVGVSHVAELWSYLKLLEKHGFISVQRIVRGKKSRISITPLIYESLLRKFYTDHYGSRYADPTLTLNKIFQISLPLSQIPLTNLFSVRDCTDFIEGESKETPLAKATKRLWVLAFELKKLADIYPPLYDYFAETVSKPHVKALFLLAKEVELTPDKETVKIVEKELKKLGWNIEEIKRNLEKCKKKLIKKYVPSELKKTKKVLEEKIRKLEELIKEAERGEWNECFNNYIEG